jgi:acetoacetate decarboxylase
MPMEQDSERLIMSSKTTAADRKSENFWMKMREKRKKRQNSWDNAQLVLADVPLDYHEVKNILPWGMRPSNPPMATLFFANYPAVAYPLFPYKEVAMMVHVRTPLGRGRHCCWIIVDDDPAMILGREMLGFPKKTGVFTFDEKKGGINASITRRGIAVMSMKAVRGARETSPQPVFDIKTFHTGGMGQHMAFSPIWMFRPNEVIRESCKADIQLTLNRSEYDPVARLVAGEPRNGRIVVMDIPGGSPYMLPVGFAGPGVFGRTFNMRFR